jgi:hypothetical protein
MHLTTTSEKFGEEAMVESSCPFLEKTTFSGPSPTTIGCANKEAEEFFVYWRGKDNMQQTIARSSTTGNIRESLDL